MKKINRMATSFLLAFGMVCNSYAIDVFEHVPFDFNDEEFIAGKVDFTPVGTVLIWTQNTIPKSWLECDGKAVDKNKYPELYKMMHVLPDYRGRFLQGHETGKNVGDRLEAGLPNITGSTRHIVSGDMRYDGKGDGNFRIHGFVKTHILNNITFANGVEEVLHGWKHDRRLTGSIYFDASLVSKVYRNDIDTVQPPSVIVKYIIKAE